MLTLMRVIPVVCVTKMRGNIVKNTTCLENMLYIHKNETTYFGLYWPSSGFHALTQFCRLFLKYSGNVKMANKGRNM